MPVVARRLADGTLQIAGIVNELEPGAPAVRLTSTGDIYLAGTLTEDSTFAGLLRIGGVEITFNAIEEKVVFS